jgi:hypothetical protein
MPALESGRKLLIRFLSYKHWAPEEGIMKVWNRWAAMTIVMPLAFAVSACDRDAGDERAALYQDELDRDLELALRGDTALASFEDVAPPIEEAPAPVVRPQPQAPPRTAPAPQPQAPRPSAPAPAQPAPSQPVWATSTVGIGTTMAVTLNQTLSTESNQPGDSFTATLNDALRDENGQVVVPAGATIRGRVTQVEKSGRIGETAVMKLAFEAVSFGGNSYSMDATVIEANPQRTTRQSTAEQAAKIGAGAAAGAVLGRVLGRDTRSTIKGAAIGAAAGTAIAMGTSDVDAVLAAGSRMVIRLDSPIQVRRQVS